MGLSELEPAVPPHGLGSALVFTNTAYPPRPAVALPDPWSLSLLCSLGRQDTSFSPVYLSGKFTSQYHEHPVRPTEGPGNPPEKQSRPFVCLTRSPCMSPVGHILGSLCPGTQVTS